MKVGVVPFSWFLITKGMSVKSNMALFEEVERRCVSKTDLVAVKAVWDEMNEKAKAEYDVLKKNAVYRLAQEEADRVKREKLKSTFHNVDLKS